MQPALPALESAVGATIASAASRWPESISVPSTTATPPARHRPARIRATFACALLALFAGALAGCGSSDTPGTSADPATAVPAAAVLYAGATVRPTGTLETNALAAGKALSHQADPYARLARDAADTRLGPAQLRA